MSYETILYETKERIAYITAEPGRVYSNAYNDTMGDELLQAHRAFDQDDDLHVPHHLQGQDAPFALGPTSDSVSCAL